MDNRLLEEAIRRAGMDPKLVKPENALPVTVKEFILKPTAEEKPVEQKKVEYFEWQDSLRTLTTLMKTGRPADPKPPPEKKKIWKWLEQKEEGKMSQARPLPPVDFSGVGLKSFETEVQVEPRPTKKPPKTDDEGKFLSKGVRFRRNGLTSMAGLDIFLEKRFADPSSIEWLDLSYNSISEINPVLSMMPNLKMLYLHSNCIDDLDEVRKLRYLPNLKSLTLFGNPIEASMDYRLKIMAAILTLKKFDWTVITARERELARIYVKMMEEKDREEKEDLKRQEKAAEDRREKRRKAAEKRKLRTQEEKEAAKAKLSEAKEEVEIDFGFQPIVKNEEIKKEESLEEMTEELSEEEATVEEVTEESELEEVIRAASLTDPGPLDVKGKYKLHPDPLSAVSLLKDVEAYPSDTSLFSTETVTIEQIQEEFNALKELEANADHNWGSNVRF